MSHKIPILNLKEQYSQIAQQLEQSVVEVLRSGNYILGKHGASLETQIANLCGCKHGIGVANGTDALYLSLWALGIGPGDEVITTPFTFAATAEAITLLDAKPVFVDIDEKSFNINPNLFEAAIGPKTKAILPVHLYGQPADMDPIIEIAKRHKLKIVEDNAQAIGATYKGRPTGSLGDAGCISFYPTKNLGAVGDAGMIVTNDDTLAERLRTIRAHGMRKRYYHDELGVNSRLDELQAVSLLTKLPFLSAWNERRRAIAKLYNNKLSACSGVITPKEALASQNEHSHVWHQYTIRIPSKKSSSILSRDEVSIQLDGRGIGSMCYYPVPLHEQQAFSHLGYRAGDFPVTEKVSDEVLSLPMYPELSDSQIEEVARAIIEICSPKEERSFLTVNIAQSAIVNIQ
jgi:dTDP-4-amino-4,6-dideoxygalactose transaminase